MDLGLISTKRLLTWYKNLRKCDDDTDDSRLERIKKELNSRKHIFMPEGIDLKTISTKRLLTLYRNLRKDLSYPPDPDTLSTGTDEDWDFLDSMKKELDSREHIPKEKPVKKQKRTLKYRRK